MTNRLDTNGHSPPMGRSLASVLSNILELSEFQLRMIVTDIKVAARRAVLPIIWLAVFCALVAGVTLTLLIGIAEGVAAGTDLSRSNSYLIVSGLAACLAMGLVTMAIAGLRKSATELRHSYDELSKNVACIKGAFLPRHDEK